MPLIEIPKSVLAKYEGRDNPTRAIVETLRDCAYLPEGRKLTLDNETLNELERLAGLPIENQAALLRFVKQRSSFTIEGVEVELSPEQVKKIQTEASFYLREYDAYLKGKVSQMLRDGLGV